MTASARPRLWGRDFTLTLLGTFAFFASFFYLLSVLPDYIDGIGGAKWQVGAIVGGFSAVPLLIRPFAGRWSDRGRRKLMMRAGLVITAASLALMVLSADLLSLFALRVVQGIGMATFPTAAGSMVAEVTPEPRRGEGLGFFGMASNGSQMIAPAIGIAIASRWGFDAVFLVSAATALAALLIVEPVAEPPTQPAATLDEAPTLIPRAAIFPMAIFLTVTFAFTATAAFLPLLSSDRGLGNAGLFFVALGATSFLLRPLSGLGADRFGRLAVAVPGLLFTAVAMWTLAVAQDAATLIAAGPALGAGLAAAHTALFALSLDRVPASQLGGATAVFQLSWDLGGTAGGLALGVVASVAGVAAVYWLAGAVALGGVVAVYAGRVVGLTRPRVESASEASR